MKAILLAGAMLVCGACAGQDTARAGMQQVSDSLGAGDKGFYFFDSPGISPAGVQKLRIRPGDYPQFEARIAEYVNVTDLEMDSIPLVKIPLRLKQLGKLERICITRCMVNELPEWLGSLEH